MLDDSGPIHGYVPTQPTQRRKPGRPKRLPDIPQKPPETPSECACAGCARPLAEVTFPLVEELVRIARDRMIETGDAGVLDLLYLAARLDGYCTVGCWRQHTTPPEQLTRLLERKCP